jgi:hypothetical protein
LTNFKTKFTECSKHVINVAYHEPEIRVLVQIFKIWLALDTRNSNVHINTRSCVKFIRAHYFAKKNNLLTLFYFLHSQKTTDFWEIFHLFLSDFERNLLNKKWKINVRFSRIELISFGSKNRLSVLHRWSNTHFRVPISV